LVPVANPSLKMSNHTYFSNQSQRHSAPGPHTANVSTGAAPGTGAPPINSASHLLNGPNGGGNNGERPRSQSRLSLSLSGTGGEKDGNGGNGAGNGLDGTTSTARTVHPLRSTWVFWFRQHRLGKVHNYEEGIKKITAFSSVESFWSLWTHLTPPGMLQPTTDYLLFHSDVRRPVWEDPMNIDGGKWIVRLRKGVADRLWEDLVLATIGDQFEESDSVCGCVLSVRMQEDILSVWHRDEKDTAAKNRIKETIRRCLNLPPSMAMEYKTNNDSLQDKSSFRTLTAERTTTS